MPRPERVLELVLDVEQPDADRGGEQHDRQMHEQERPDADEPDQHRRDHSAIAALVAMVLSQGRQPPRIMPDRQPVLQEEQIGRARCRT